MFPHDLERGALLTNPSERCAAKLDDDESGDLQLNLFLLGEINEKHGFGVGPTEPNIHHDIRVKDE
jgi:hypothetical protein